MGAEGKGEEGKKCDTPTLCFTECYNCSSGSGRTEGKQWQALLKNVLVLNA